MPAVHVATSEFERAARSNARARGYANLPIVVVPHPLETRPEAEVLEIAEASFPDFVRLLTDQDPAKDPAEASARSAMAVAK